MTPERVELIYESIDKLIVDLDPDPIVRGPKYLQDLVSKTRGYLNQVSLYLSEVRKELQGFNVNLSAREDVFQISYDDLLSNDIEVKSLPSIEDRKAKINAILSNDRKELVNLKKDIHNLEYVEKSLRHRQKELEGTMTAIRLQKSLIDSEIDTGAFYGDESSKSRGSRMKHQEEEGDLEESLKELFSGGSDLTSPSSEVTQDDMVDEDGDLESLLTSLEPCPEPAKTLEPKKDEKGPKVLKSVDEEVGDLDTLLTSLEPFDSPPEIPKTQESKEGSDKEDPSILKFLDGEDFSDIFDSI